MECFITGIIVGPVVLGMIYLACAFLHSLLDEFVTNRVDKAKWDHAAKYHHYDEYRIVRIVEGNFKLKRKN